MPVAQSKELPAAEQVEKVDEAKQKRAKLLRIVKLSVFQSVAQHVITLQSEPLVMDAICKGDTVRSAALLGTSAGIVGALSIFLNQIGGKLSDSLGRKPGLLLGPLGNMILGAAVYKNPTSKLGVLVCRILRMTITTFSNTVIVGALLGDVFTGYPKEQALAGAQIATVVGLAVGSVPFVEGSILSRTRSPRFSFLLLSLLGATQLMYVSTVIPETLTADKRAPLSRALQLSSLNPLGFLNIYTKGSQSIRKIATIMSLQGFLEGKNLSDVSLVFLKRNMSWGVTQIRNWISFYGGLCIISGMSLTPALLKRLSVRAYTSLTNMCTIVAYAIRAFIGGRPGLFYATSPLLLPSVNGMSSRALGPVIAEKAAMEGFGKGEFSAYANNLRAIVSALAPIILGNYYAWAQGKGWGGSAHWVIGLIGGVLPELAFQCVTDKELKISTN